MNYKIKPYKALINITRLSLAGIFSLMILSACGGGKYTNKEKQDTDILALQQLEISMQGSFDSNQQSLDDSEYYDISLEMHPIWQHRTDGPWLYVEQSVTKTKDRPYRQRVYQLIQRENAIIESKVYTLKDPKVYSGGYKDLARFALISPRDLIEREGCSVFLSLQVDASYNGSTKPKLCQSSLRGASYATSTVTVFKDRIESWDQGFDSNDKQVWGAVKGAYIFDKK